MRQPPSDAIGSRPSGVRNSPCARSCASGSGDAPRKGHPGAIHKRRLAAPRRTPAGPARMSHGGGEGWA
eukprot:2847568-Pyramimonas_sp.AAC.1